MRVDSLWVGGGFESPHLVSAYFPFWIFWLACTLVRLNVLVSLSFGSRAFIVHDVNFIAG